MRIFLYPGCFVSMPFSKYTYYNTVIHVCYSTNNYCQCIDCCSLIHPRHGTFPVQLACLLLPYTAYAAIHKVKAIIQIQSSLRTKDTLGTGLLSFARRLSLSRRFMIFQSILIVLSLNALKCMVRAVKMIIKWLVCSVFSVNIAQAEFFLFLKYWLLQIVIWIQGEYYYRACGIISRPPRLRQRWAWHR